ncbi:hypothetical protein Tco_0129011 [Tanacetum coccineum]
MKRTRQPQQESTVVRGKLPRGRNDFEESSLRLLERKAYPIFWHKFAHKSFTVFQMDVKTAFLHGTLKEDMYVCQPEAALKCRDWEMTFSLVQNTSYQSPCGIFINQSKYVLEIHKKYGMKSCDPIGTPVEIKDKLDCDQHGSQSMQRNIAKPTEKHLKEVKRIFCYLRGTVNTGLWYTKDSGFELIGFSDADYAGCKDSFKSTSGGAQFLGEKLVIQSHEQPESIPDTYVVNENNSNIISDIPSMDPDRDKEEHDNVNYEQQCAFFVSFINKLKCDVENCNEVNREARHVNALLTNELERYKEKEKHFARETTNESKYCKKIKLLNDEISNLKSQACEKDKTFAKENGKFDELQKAGQTDQTLHMLLPKEDNVYTGKQGLGFENQNDDVNLSLLSKSKDLAPCLYTIDEMGKGLFSDHKIISEEELKCEAEKCLKVKQRKSPLSYHGFVYSDTQFKEPPKVPMKTRDVNLKNIWNKLNFAMLKFEKEIVSKQNPPQEVVYINSSFEDNVKRIAKNQLSEEFEPLVKDVNLQLNHFEKGLVKEMKDDFKYVMSLKDEFDEKCLILDIQQEFFKTQFE